MTQQVFHPQLFAYLGLSFETPFLEQVCFGREVAEGLPEKDEMRKKGFKSRHNGDDKDNNNND